MESSKNVQVMKEEEKRSGNCFRLKETISTQVKQDFRLSIGSRELKNRTLWEILRNVNMNCTLDKSVIIMLNALSVVLLCGSKETFFFNFLFCIGV